MQSKITSVKTFQKTICIKEKNSIYNKYIMGLLFFIIFLSCISISHADPGTPFNIVGYVFNADGNGAPNGIPILINNTIYNIITTTQVYAPPVPQLAGIYSGTINGSTGNNIILYSWNNTNYGKSSATLAATTNVNITLNLSRVPEPNITIITPINNTTEELGVPFNSSVNISILFGDGNCTVSLSFSNYSVLNFSVGENKNHNLGNYSINSVITSNFSITSHAVGYSSITANASCMPNGPLFDIIPIITTYNITVIDTTSPKINLLSPTNTSVFKTNKTIIIVYNVTDLSAINNCDLYVDDIFNYSDITIIKNINQTFNINLTNGLHNLSVSCSDIYSNIVNSSTIIVNISIYPPNITAIISDSIISLSAGTTTKIFCNTTIYSVYGNSNIISANATFYFSSNKSTDIDNPNTHYSNSSCINTYFFGNEKKFSCSFDVWSFALNGSWNCSISTIDADNLSFTSSNSSSIINPLYALNVTNIFMDFGNIQAGMISNNITQILTNFGNQPINVSVYTYGNTIGDGHAFSCGSSNISPDNMRFSYLSTTNFSQKTPLNTTPKLLGITIPKQTTVGLYKQNTTWWQLFVPLNISDVGTCIGSIVFQAEKS